MWRCACGELNHDNEKYCHNCRREAAVLAALDKMNKILADGGSDKKWTAEDYVRDQFEKAMKETMLRAEDKVVK